MSEYQSNKQWKKWYDAYQESSGSKVKFCKTHKLNYHQFLYWCNKLGKKTPKLIPVEITVTFPQRCVILFSYNPLILIDYLQNP